MAKKKRVVGIKILPGESTDGSGRCCIHLFVPDEKGPFVENHALKPVFEDGEQVKGQVVFGPVRGRLACGVTDDPSPKTRNGVTFITMRTDHPHATTCPQCIASEHYKRIADAYKSVSPTQ